MRKVELRELNYGLKTFLHSKLTIATFKEKQNFKMNQLKNKSFQKNIKILK